MEYYQFSFETRLSERSEILIALLSNMGFIGFEEEDTLVKGFINVLEFDENLFKSVLKIIDVRYSQSVIQEINWNKKWESEFEPIFVKYPGTQETFVHVRAHFHPESADAAHDIVITPKMSFGTGHHATTYMMIEQMSRLDFKDHAVIDFGTGTAVLAILAEKLGASMVTAIDNDEWSIENAQENIGANGCRKITLLKADVISNNINGSIVLANINLNTILSNLDAIKSSFSRGTSILFSGILTQDRQAITGALLSKSFKINLEFERDGWVLLYAEI